MRRAHGEGGPGVASFDTQDSPVMEGLLSPPSTDEESEAGQVEGLFHGHPARKWLERGLEPGLPGSRSHFLTDPLLGEPPSCGSFDSQGPNPGR